MIRIYAKTGLRHNKLFFAPFVNGRLEIVSAKVALPSVELDLI